MSARPPRLHQAPPPLGAARLRVLRALADLEHHAIGVRLGAIRGLLGATEKATRSHLIALEMRGLVERRRSRVDEGATVYLTTDAGRAELASRLGEVHA
jgi:DNA-binding MarR family transcriptional regulator